MPTTASFRGITIRLYPDDHLPLHFHAFYGDSEAMIDINALTSIAGGLPPAQLREVLAWAGRHQADLVDRWQRCQNHQPVPRIPHP
ncbi:MAG: DUF4160 domain-containing protein [Opitutae bacterium]|nr:DUF4160 domain-containing protein [Opitutae bacterium]